MELGFLFSAHRLMMVYICTKFHENILDGYRANTIYTAKISKGHNSVENVVGVTVLFLCKLSHGGLYFYKVS